MGEIDHLDFDTDIPHDDIDNEYDDDGSGDFDNFIRCPCGFVAGSDDAVNGSEMVSIAYKDHVCVYHPNKTSKANKIFSTMQVIALIVSGFVFVLVLRASDILP